MDIAVKHITLQQFSTPVRVENYCVFIFRGEGTIAVDTVPYPYEGNTLLFLSPYHLPTLPHIFHSKQYVMR